MHRLVCQVCSVEFESRLSNGKYCGKQCQWRESSRRRSENGSAAASRARDRARIAAYNASYSREVACAGCGVPLKRKNTAGRRPACGSKCRSYLRYGAWPVIAVPDSHPSRSSLVPDEHPCRTNAERPRFAAGHCEHCGGPFVADRLACSNLLDKFCSDRCGKRSARIRRSARKRSNTPLPRVPVRRHRVHVRDSWTCLLCGGPVDRVAKVPHPLAATLDHVVPLAKGGAHNESNLQTAHFLCNSRKGDRFLEPSY